MMVVVNGDDVLRLLDRWHGTVASSLGTAQDRSRALSSRLFHFLTDVGAGSNLGVLQNSFAVSFVRDIAIVRKSLFFF